MCSTTHNLWQVREYDPAKDADMVSSWWRGRGRGEFPHEVLPPCGLVVEADGVPMAAIWLYMAVGVGVCWLEWTVSKPGLSMAESRRAFTHLVEAMDAQAAAHNYPLMVAHVLPPMSRLMKSIGFSAEGREKVTVARKVTYGS